MRIVCIANYYPPHVGGLEMVARAHARALVSAGHEVSVVTCKVAERAVDDPGITVVPVRAWNFFDRYFGIPFSLVEIDAIREIRRAVNSADVVHIHDVFYLISWIGYFFARYYQKPVVLVQHVGVVEHASFIVFLQHLIYATIGALMFFGSTRIIVFNPIVKKFLISQGVNESKIIMLGNGVNVEEFQPPRSGEKEQIRKRLGLPIDRLVVLFVGRLVPKKGYKVLFEARDPAYDIVFVGSGEVPQAWRFVSNVHFLGSQDHTQLSDIYRAADLFVFPARGEMFTLAMQEAAASGLPIITTDEPGYTEYDINRRLMTFTAPNVEELKQHIQSLISDPALRERMATYSRMYALERFDSRAHEKALIEAYEQVAALMLTTVTTSWDDGHILDLKLAELLRKYGIEGTFYVSPENREIPAKERLTQNDVKKLSEDFEIGAHTLTHPYLPDIDLTVALREIVSSKQVLEDLLGKPVVSFCYPKGGFSDAHKSIVRGAGFTSARTTKRYSLRRESDPYTLPTSVHAYDHWSDIWPLLFFARLNLFYFFRLYRRWDEQAIALFDRAFKRGGVFHLWGHSWEIENNGDWARLERVLRHIANRPSVQYRTVGHI